MKKAYIAGPMSNHSDFNFPAFFTAAAKLKKEGWDVFNPAAEDLKEWGDLETVRKKATYRFCLKKDLNYILDNEDLTIFLLPGWQTSKGVAAEVALANALKLPIVEL